MPDRRAVRALGVAGPGRLELLSLEEDRPRDGQFAVDTLFSGLSAGTELTYFKGTNPYLHSGWDPDLGVFRRDRAATPYPVRRLGYMEVGRVVDSRAEAVAEGRLLAMAYGHKTGHTADPAAERFVPVPQGIDPLLGIYVAHMGPICANGLLHAAADLVGTDVRSLGDGVRGRNVLVTGAGVVGLLVALFARLHGAAEVAVADHSPRRLAAAAALGFTTIDEGQTEPWRVLKERWRHAAADRGADVAFQCRGQVSSLAAALRALRPQGSAIDLAFYQGGADELRLGEEFHHNGLSIRCAQIGRVPRGLGHAWSRHRLSVETIELLRAFGGDIQEHLITDIVPFEEAPALFQEIAERRREPLQAVFAVSGEDRRSSTASYSSR